MIYDFKKKVQGVLNIGEQNTEMGDTSPQQSPQTSARVADARKNGVASTEIITRMG